MDFFQSEYLEVVDEVLDLLAEMEIPFDITRDRLITVRNDDDMTWHLVIEVDDESFEEDLDDDECQELEEQLKKLSDDELKKLLEEVKGED